MGAAVGFIRFSFIFLSFSSCLLFASAWDDFLDFLGFENEIYYEPYYESYESQIDHSSICAVISPSILQGYTRIIRLSGVTGRNQLPGLYHHESYAAVPLQMDWKCGLHLLYNMCEIERILGISDISDDEFVYHSEAVPALLAAQGSYPSDIKKAAKRMIKSPVYIIEHSDDIQKINIVCSSESEVRLWNKIISYLSLPGDRCVHFGCLLYDEDSLIYDDDFDDEGTPECHIFLISAVKLADGSVALYLLDNMNKEASRSAQAQMREHAEYIHRHVFG